MPHYATHRVKPCKNSATGFGHDHINSNSSHVAQSRPTGGSQEPRGALCHIWADKNDAGRLPGLRLLLLLLLPLLITVIVIARVALMKKPTPAVRATITETAARTQHTIGIFHQYMLVYYVRFIDTDTGIYLDTYGMLLKCSVADGG